MSNALGAYTRDLRAYPALNEQAEDRIRAAIRSGNESARYALVAGSLRFVAAMARKHSRGNRDRLEDLIATGNLALVQAAREFDVDAEQRFVAFLHWRLRTAFHRYRVSLHGLSSATYYRYRQQGRPLPEFTTLDDPEEQPVVLVTDATPETAAIHKQDAQLVAKLRERLREQLDQLPRRERDIVRGTGAKAGDPITRVTIAHNYGISRGWINVLRRRTLASLRGALLEAAS